MIPTIDPNQLHLYQLAGLATCILLFMAIIFSLLVLRQARQMTEVLPTRLAPWVKIIVVAYTFCTVAAFAFGITLALA